jgi:hypothetical protein
MPVQYHRESYMAYMEPSRAPTNWNTKPGNHRKTVQRSEGLYMTPQSNVQIQRLMHVTQVKPLARLNERGTWQQQTKAVQAYFTLNRLGQPVWHTSTNWQACECKHKQNKKFQPKDWQTKQNKKTQPILADKAIVPRKPVKERKTGNLSQK